MSGDFENWDNSPSQHEAPKPERNLVNDYDYKKEHRAEQIRVLVKLLAAIAILIFGILWYHGWRPF